MFERKRKTYYAVGTKDLIEMNKMKANQEEPSNYLLDKLDELLLELEK